MFYSTITSKGTITLPADIRHALGLESGTKVLIERQQHTGAIVVRPAISLVEIQRRNQEAMKPAAPYKSGEGTRKFVEKTYGS